MTADVEAEPHLSSEDELVEPPDFGLDAALRLIGNRLNGTGPIRPQVSFEDLSKALPEELPARGCDANLLVDELADFAETLSRRNAQPGFLGFICSPGLPTDPVAHAVKALLNQNVSGFVSAPGATVVEQRVVRWFTDLCRLPSHSSGAFVAGGSMGNFTGLACAVYAKAGHSALDDGIADHNLVIYCSTEAHFSVERTVRLLGLGSRAVRKIPTDPSFRMVPGLLEAAIQQDIDQGNVPCAVVATLGTTATGSIDPLDAIGTLARKHALWLHVDAAYGGAALLAPRLRKLLGDLSMADSIAVDLHKWLFVALDAGMILLRDPSVAERVFAFHSDYVAASQSEPTFLRLGLEASRPFRALAPYWALRHYGSRKLANNIQFNADCVRYLAERVRARSELSLVNAPELSICCFRYVGQGLEATRVDSINESIRAALEAEGQFYLSPTQVSGRPVLRVCLVSSATRPTQLRQLVQRVIELGNQYAAQAH